MKRLLIIIENLKIGGGQNVVCKLVENIDQTHYHIKVLCCDSQRGSIIEKRISAVCEVEYLGLRHTTVSGLLKAFRSINRYAPDIIHAHLDGVRVALPWCLVHKKRIVITVHTKPEKAFNQKIERFVRFGIKRKLVYLIAVSEANCAACKRYFGLNDEQCYCVNNGIDLGKTRISSHDQFTFINVATHNKNKNQEMILTCFSRMAADYTNIGLILVGDGPEHKRLIEIAEELRIDRMVQFTGMVDDPERYYSVSDAYIQASRREAMPMSVLEAMGFGLPIIATDVGGLRDVVQDNGFLVPAGDENALYYAMRDLLSVSESERKRMSKRSLEIVSNYSSEKMASEYMAVYVKVYGLVLD